MQKDADKNINKSLLTLLYITTNILVQFAINNSLESIIKAVFHNIEHGYTSYNFSHNAPNM